MRFIEIEYTPEQKALFEDLKGSELQICLLKHRKVADPDNLARAAAIAGMQVFSQRWAERFARLNPGKDPLKYWHHKFIDGEEPRETWISFDEFFGDGYDLETGGVSLFRYAPNFKSRNTVQSDKGNGLVYALYNPPYGFLPPGIERGQKWNAGNAAKLEAAQKEFLDRFLAVLDIDPNRSVHELMVYKISDNWSNFFDAGKEWWGTFFWTILHRDRREVTVIAASATD
jgi:hypothetical protein